MNTKLKGDLFNPTPIHNNPLSINIGSRLYALLLFLRSDLDSFLNLLLNRIIQSTTRLNFVQLQFQYHICYSLIHQSIGSLVHSSKHELYLQSRLPFFLNTISWLLLCWNILLFIFF